MDTTRRAGKTAIVSGAASGIDVPPHCGWRVRAPGVTAFDVNADALDDVRQTLAGDGLDAPARSCPACAPPGAARS